jgi:hypothetical protein
LEAVAVIRALSLTQPYASLVGAGKWIETRSWRTQHRGVLAIHAAQTFPAWARNLCEEEPFCSALAAAGFDDLALLPRGAVVAVVWLDNVQAITPDTIPSEPERSFGNYACAGKQRWAWHLRDVFRLPTPQPARGALSLWPWDAPYSRILSDIYTELEARNLTKPSDADWFAWVWRAWFAAQQRQVGGDERMQQRTIDELLEELACATTR